MNFLKKLFGGASPSAPVPPGLPISAPPPEPPAEPAVAAGLWRARPIFISSTFRDMHAERDWLRDHVFPELEERLRAHRHHLGIIDLRQGVETASLGKAENREAKVLKVCLAEIERSRPFLIVLLGDRYGWTPRPERIEEAARTAGFPAGAAAGSVTALEIEFGIFRKHPDQRRHCFFYFRDPLPYDRMPPEKAAEYSDAHAPDGEARARKQALDALKLRIETDPELGPRARHFQAGWDPHANCVGGLEAWGRQVLADLWGELEPETRAFALAAPPTWQAQERAAIEEFAEHRLRGFTGRETVVGQLLETGLAPGGGGGSVRDGRPRLRQERAVRSGIQAAQSRAGHRAPGPCRGQRRALCLGGRHAAALG